MKETPLSLQSIVDRADFASNSVSGCVEQLLPDARFHYKVAQTFTNVVGGKEHINTSYGAIPDGGTIPPGAQILAFYNEGDTVGEPFYHEGYLVQAIHTKEEHSEMYIDGIPVTLKTVR